MSRLWDELMRRTCSTTASESVWIDSLQVCSLRAVSLDFVLLKVSMESCQESLSRDSLLRKTFQIDDNQFSTHTCVLRIASRNRDRENFLTSFLYGFSWIRQSLCRKARHTGLRFWMTKIDWTSTRRARMFKKNVSTTTNWNTNAPPSQSSSKRVAHNLRSSKSSSRNVMDVHHSAFHTGFDVWTAQISPFSHCEFQLTTRQRHLLKRTTLRSNVLKLHRLSSTLQSAVDVVRPSPLLFTIPSKTTSAKTRYDNWSVPICSS